MGWSDINSRDAVIAAIEEYDRMGADSFFEKYGFQEAREYHLYYGGKLYPSKAILGVAHGYQYTDLGPLKAGEFSGGAATVKKQLELMDFVVVFGSNLDIRLELHEDYSRNQVHEIFSPHTRFTPQSGTWGLQGIVSIPDRPGDFVFFVTYGKQQGDHIFDESVTEDGVLTWQSQPSQTLDNKQIIQLINHDELSNNIYLFLRTSDDTDYTYLGRLKYISHDILRENPVYFQWQIMEWPIPQYVLQRIKLKLLPSESGTDKVDRDVLVQSSLPPRNPRVGERTESFRKKKKTNYSSDDEQNREIGLAGELLVLTHEIELLTKLGREDLAKSVRHVSQIEGDSAGYDILSFTPNGLKKFIEVKTTTGGVNSSFYITSNELSFSQNNIEYYYLYRVYEYNRAINSGKFFIVNNPIDSDFDLKPTQYRVSRR